MATTKRRHRLPQGSQYRYSRITNRATIDPAPALTMAKELFDEGVLYYPKKTDPEKEPSLADMFVAQTYIEGAKFRGRDRKLLDEAMARYRNEMRVAHRFVLDDEFVEYCTHAATAPAQKTLYRLQFATLPYETTWIEFNLRAKVRTMRQIHKRNVSDLSDVAPRCGMLLQRINDTDMVCTLVSERPHGAMPHLSCYFFSTVETDFIASNRAFFGCNAVSFQESDEVVIPTVMNASKVNVNDPAQVFKAFGPSFGKAALWGYTTAGSVGMQDYSESRDLHVPMFLCRHGDVGFSRYYQAYMPIIVEQKREVDLHQVYSVEVTEFTGHGRWIITMLAMLNEVPIHTDLVARSHQMRIDHTRKKQFLDYHKVTLRLPKTKPMPWIERHLRGQSDRHHRAHEVRGHWRTYLHEKACGREEHDWVYDWENGYRLCGKCEAFSRMIKEHVRGNPELGWVRKEYVVKKEHT